MQGRFGVRTSLRRKGLLMCFRDAPNQPRTVRYERRNLHTQRLAGRVGRLKRVSGRLEAERGLNLGTVGP